MGGSEQGCRAFQMHEGTSRENIVESERRKLFLLYTAAQLILFGHGNSIDELNRTFQN